MSLFTRLRLGPRLGGAFLLIVLLLMGSIGFAIARLSAQDDRMDRVVRSDFGALLAVVRLQTESEAIGTALRDSILADRGEAIKAALAEVMRLVADMEATTKEVEKLAGAEPGGPVEQIRKTQGPYLATVGKMADSARSGDNDGAREQIVSPGARDALRAYADALAGAVAAQRAQAEQAREQGQQAFATSRNVMSVLALLASAFAVVVGIAITHSVVRPAQQAIASARRIAAGDLTQDLEARGNDEMADLIGAMQAMQVSLRSTVREIRDGAQQVSTASAEIAQGNQDLSSRTENQSSNLQQTASAMEQMSSTLRHTADAAAQANQLASTASAVAVRGGQVVSEVVTTMNEINASSRQISDIIGVIDGIAFQTNILALNAAVEAARAGEHGRGFAVVASEVRALAQRSASAAREIKSLIGNSVEKVASGSQLVANAGATMGEIVASVQQVSAIIADITDATSEQHSGIGSVNAAVSQLDQMTQQNAALVEQSTAASASLREQAQRLSTLVDAFRLHAHDGGLQAGCPG
jgi:methyl-accepting chemotaxis protein